MSTDFVLEQEPFAQPSPTCTAPHMDLDTYLSRLERRDASKRRSQFKKIAKDPTLVLFDELAEYLRQPLIARAAWSDEMGRSDRFDVPLVTETEDQEAESGDTATDIPYESWGKPWVVDDNGLSWSAEAVQHLQIQLLWESLEEMALTNNELEKWNVLKWIFMPAIRKYYVWSKALGKSRVFELHERDHPFSFHNCCMAARADEDLIRDTFRRYLDPEALNAVLKVCTFA